MRTIHNRSHIISRIISIVRLFAVRGELFVYYKFVNNPDLMIAKNSLVEKERKYLIIYKCPNMKH